MERSLRLSRIDAERIGELSTHPGFMALIKAVRQQLEPEYFTKMENAKTTEEKASSLDSYVAFTKAFSQLALFPQTYQAILRNQNQQGEEE